MTVLFKYWYLIFNTRSCRPLPTTSTTKTRNLLSILCRIIVLVTGESDHILKCSWLGSYLQFWILFLKNTVK